MYQTILIPVENAETDQTILRHIRPLARLHGSKLVLMHVADGWAARNFEQLKLQESEEMIHDRDYLRTLRAGTGERRIRSQLRPCDGRSSDRNHQAGARDFR